MMCLSAPGVVWAQQDEPDLEETLILGRPSLLELGFVTGGALAGTPEGVRPGAGLGLGARLAARLPLLRTKVGATLGLEAQGSLGYRLSFEDVPDEAGLYGELGVGAGLVLPLETTLVVLRAGLGGHTGERVWWSDANVWRLEGRFGVGVYGRELGGAGIVYRYAPTLSEPARRVRLEDQDLGSPTHSAHRIGLDLPFTLDEDEESLMSVQLHYTLGVTSFFARDPVLEHGVWFSYNLLLGGVLE